ncbi:tautomerase family protein [Neptuniibacter sp. QD37_6]|uniref:tautomerase family protein n=1 Tax=Neptuniibacter sp. QD37_6 TaxID=3398210 RepID=UPI0039F618B1
MPYISIHVSSDLTELQIKSLVEGTTNIMANILHKKAELTAVSITKMDKEHWFIGNKLATNSVSAYVDAKISKDTNTEKEKSDALSAFNKLLDNEIGPLTPTSYVVLDEVPTTDWGYDGLSQQARMLKRTESGVIDMQYYTEKGKKERSDFIFSKLQKFRQAIFN